jgi:uncharacterized membrane protein
MNDNEDPPDGLAVEDLGHPETEIRSPVAGRKYDPGRDREKIRGGLAVASFALFAAVVLVPLLAVVLDVIDWADIKGITTVVLPVVVSVFGSITGFYYGTKSKSDDQ